MQCSCYHLLSLRTGTLTKRTNRILLSLVAHYHEVKGRSLHMRLIVNLRHHMIPTAIVFEFQWRYGTHIIVRRRHSQVVTPLRSKNTTLLVVLVGGAPITCAHLRLNQYGRALPDSTSRTELNTGGFP